MAPKNSGTDRDAWFGRICPGWRVSIRVMWTREFLSDGPCALRQPPPLGVS